MLPRHVAKDRKTLERFRREARSAARLHHTNIVPVFEVGQDGDTVFYAMQFIQGQGLDLVIEELDRLRARSALRAPILGRLRDGFFARHRSEEVSRSERAMPGSAPSTKKPGHRTET